MCAHHSTDGARPGIRARWLLAGSLVVIAFVAMAPYNASAKDRVRATLSATVMSTSGELHAVIRIDPHDENRLLSVALDGPLYYASTDVQLDGATAARVHDLWWRHIPPGEYTVTATLACATGRSFSDQRYVKVIGSADLSGQ